MNRFIKGLSYTFKRNLGMTDRIIRTTIAVALLSSWYFSFVSGIIGTILMILALMIFGTVATSRCGVTYWLNANTMNLEEKKELDKQGIPYE